MAENGVDKNLFPSKVPSKPSASAPSSGGTSAPGIVFDYCPTNFGGPDEDTPSHSSASHLDANRHSGATPELPAPATPSQPQTQERAPSAHTPPPVVKAAKPEVKTPEPEKPKMEKPTQKTPAFEFPFASALFGSGSEFAGLTASRLSVRMLNAAQTNFNDSFEFAKRVAAAKDLGEVLQLQTAYLQQQFASVTAQTEEMAEFAQKFSTLKGLSGA
jgi:phasin family protein